MKKETNEKNLKERIQDCLFVLDFDTQRMSSGGNQAYRELKNIVIDLYNDNIKIIDKLKNYELDKSQNEEEKQI
jgi:hypothetical protein